MTEMRRRHAWHVLSSTVVTTVVTLSALVGSGCAREVQAPLRVGTHIWPGFEPLYLAREAGYYPPEDVRLVEYTTGSDGIRAFRAGAIDAVALTLDEGLLLAETSPDMAIVLVLDASHGGDAILTRPMHPSLRALKGKRVGLETSALGAYVLTRALHTVGMKSKDVRIVPLETMEQERAFKDGRVDAVVTYEPFRTKLLALGARQVFDSSQLPGEIVDVLVVRRSSVAEHQEQIGQLVQGWFKALDLLRKERRRAVVVMARRERLSAEQFGQALGGLRFYDLEENRALLTGSAPGLIPTARRLGEVMLANRLLERSPILTHLLDGTFVENAGP